MAYAYIVQTIDIDYGDAIDYCNFNNIEEAINYISDSIQDGVSEEGLVLYKKIPFETKVIVAVD